MKNRTKKRLAALCLTTVLLISLIPGTAVSAARSLEDIQGEQNQLLQKQAELQAQIDSLQAKTQDSVAYQAALAQEIKVVQSQIDTAGTSIRELDASILVLNNKVRESEKRSLATMDLFKERIKTLYKTGSLGTLEIILSADSLHDYSMKAELMKSISKHDKQLMDEIYQYLKSTEKERAELAAQKEVVASLKKNLEGKTQELAALETENQRVIETLETNTNSTKKDLNASYAYGDELANQMAAKIAEMNANRPQPTARPTPPTPVPLPEPTIAPEPPVNPEDPTEPIPTPQPTLPPEEPPEEPPIDVPGDSANFQWPCPGYIAITGEWGDGRNHKGLDMAADYGTPIYAAQSGTVMVANSSDPWGFSWGYYVSIYHNPTYSTLYAHCSSLAVSPGEEVQQGQLIGYVGSTGNSSGNHLHFEVYQDGTRVDPSQFF